MLRMIVEKHLRTWRIPPARFGRDVVGDPRFVFDLRDGREPRPRTESRVRAYIAAFEQERAQ
ncbi:hypothetical protein DAH66_19375 [Sphingomonas koreensis]|uniref:Uncharacterized protein n=1 Tax=Sphingomonas koreensis TaxID=93064 RepID=A0A430FZ88_9SPHN|nr:hypothetical protein [Sphingomonas koreensis]RSY78065.1 hypothetical protein DAH66_19375 [Sphingomonas koreensis]